MLGLGGGRMHELVVFHLRGSGPRTPGGEQAPGNGPSGLHIGASEARDACGHVPAPPSPHNLARSVPARRQTHLRWQRSRPLSSVLVTNAAITRPGPRQPFSAARCHCCSHLRYEIRQKEERGFHGNAKRRLADPARGGRTQRERERERDHRQAERRSASAATLHCQLALMRI